MRFNLKDFQEWAVDELMNKLQTARYGASVKQPQAVVQGFQNSSTVRSGEFLIGNGFGYYGFSLDTSVFRSPARIRSST